MRFTKDLKEQTKENAINKIYKKKVETVLNDLEENIQQALTTFYPKSIREWMEAAPNKQCLLSKSGINIEHNNKSLISYNEFKTIRPLINDQINWSQYMLKTPITVIQLHNHGLTLEVTSKSKIAILVNKLIKLEEHATNFNKQFNQALHGCNTVKQFYDRYPEFIKYLPNIEQTKMLVVPQEELSKLIKSAENI